MNLVENKITSKSYTMQPAIKLEPTDEGESREEEHGQERRTGVQKFNQSYFDLDKQPENPSGIEIAISQPENTEQTKAPGKAKTSEKKKSNGVKSVSASVSPVTKTNN